MYQTAFQNFDLSILPIIGLLLFVVTFALIVTWNFTYLRMKFYETESRLPLQEDRHE